METKKELNFKDRILPGSIRTRCKACGEPIIFVKTDSGKNMPINEDGTTHFATCTDANKFRKRSKP